MTELAASMHYLARHYIDGGNDEDPEFLRNVGAAYRAIDGEDADERVNEFTDLLNQTIFFILLADAGIPVDMALRATHLLTEDEEYEWFVSEEDK